MLTNTKEKVVTYLCYKQGNKPSRKIIKDLDFVFVDNNDKTYDVIKNRWNGKILKGVTWFECEDLVKQSEKFWRKQK